MEQRATVSNPFATTLRFAFGVNGTVDARFGASTAPYGIVGFGTPLLVNATTLHSFGVVAPMNTTTSAACINGSNSVGPRVMTYNETYFVDVPVVNGLAQFGYTLNASLLAALWGNSPSGMFSFDATWIIRTQRA